MAAPDPSPGPSGGGRLAAARSWARARGAGAAAEALFNFILPAASFALAQHRLGEVKALLSASAPPILWSIVQFIQRRRLDAISILVLAGIALSLLAFLGGGGVKFLQLRERMVTMAIGLAFLGSAAIGRPLIYQLARASTRARAPERAAELEALGDNPHVRRAMTVMTLVWGFGLVAEASVSAALVFALSIQQFLIVSPIIGYCTAGGLAACTFWYARRGMRRGAAARAAEAQVAASARAP